MLRVSVTPFQIFLGSLDDMHGATLCYFLKQVLIFFSFSLRTLQLCFSREAPEMFCRPRNFWMTELSFIFGWTNPLTLLVPLLKNLENIFLTSFSLWSMTSLKTRSDLTRLVSRFRKINHIWSKHTGKVWKKQISRAFRSVYLTSN